MKSKFLLIFISFSIFIFSKDYILNGIVRDSLGIPLAMVNVVELSSNSGTQTNNKGEYTIKFSTKSKNAIILFSHVGYSPNILDVDISKERYNYSFDIRLVVEANEIEEVKIVHYKRNNDNTEFLNIKDIKELPQIGVAEIENLIKTLPGVYTNNELSNRYNVRGGNFDENLIYINGIEIYKSFLIKNGTQEGISAINQNLVESIKFSNGGFEAKYGDKMSSVLDITYKQPEKFAASIDASMLGVSIFFENKDKHLPIDYIAGLRYKKGTYLFSTLDEKGLYNPFFVDFQTAINYKISPNWSLKFMVNYNKNEYNFVPDERETTFGTQSNIMNFKVYYDGAEVDQFDNLMIAISSNNRASRDLMFKTNLTLYNIFEKERYDISAQYYFDDKTNIIAVENYFKHASNKLNINVLSIEEKASYQINSSIFVQAGLKGDFEALQDKTNEWTYSDSAGYDIPYDNKINFIESYNNSNKINSLKLSGYLQTENIFSLNKSSRLSLNYGIRCNYWSFNKEFIASPRFTIKYFPSNENIDFWLSTGIYYQVPFFSEVKIKEGKYISNLKSQKSYQLILGNNFYFTFNNSKMVLTSELYYKFLRDLISYNIDNLKITYLGKNDSKGYATGLDLRLSGEFVKGVDSWVCLSLMKSMEDIDNDNQSNIPRLTDRTINFSVYFQDYLPINPNYRVAFCFNYGTGYPIEVPFKESHIRNIRQKYYSRTDIGFSRVFNKPIKNITNIVLGLDILNLFEVKNIASYTWVESVDGNKYGVPNYLTARRFNLKMTINFN